MLFSERFLIDGFLLVAVSSLDPSQHHLTVKVGSACTAFPSGAPLTCMHQVIVVEVHVLEVCRESDLVIDH